MFANSIFLKFFSNKGMKNRIIALNFISCLKDLIHVVIPSPEGLSTWTMEELANAMEDSTTKPQHLRAILEAYRRLQYSHESGSTQVGSSILALGASKLTHWILA